MAARKPIVLVSGRPAELPSGDTILGDCSTMTAKPYGASAAVEMAIRFARTAYIEDHGGGTGKTGAQNKTALDAAIASLPTTGGVVMFGRGTYLMDAFTLSKDGVSLIGQGKVSTIIQYTGTSGSLCSAASSLNWFMLARIELLAVGHVSGLALNLAGNAAWVIRAPIIYDAVISGFENGILLGQVLNCIISDIQMVGNSTVAPPHGYGIKVGTATEQATTTTLARCYVSNYGTDIYNVSCYGLVLDNVIVECAHIAGSVGLNAEVYTVGSMYSEAVEYSIIAGDAIDITALNNLSTWGIVTLSGDNAKQTSKFRTPRQFATRVGLSGDQSPSASTWTKLAFNSDTLNQGGIHSAGVFTADVPGVYKIHAQISWKGIEDAGEIYALRTYTAAGAGALTLDYNGAAGASTLRSQFCDDTIYLDAGGTLEVHAYTSKPRVINGDPTYTFCTFERVSK